MSKSHASASAFSPMQYGTISRARPSSASRRAARAATASGAAAAAAASPSVRLACSWSSAYSSAISPWRCLAVRHDVCLAVPDVFVAPQRQAASCAPQAVQQTRTATVCHHRHNRHNVRCKFLDVSRSLDPFTWTCSSIADSQKATKSA